MVCVVVVTSSGVSVMPSSDADQRAICNPPPGLVRMAVTHFPLMLSVEATREMLFAVCSPRRVMSEDA